MADTKTNRPAYAADFIKGDIDKAVLTGNPHVDGLMTVVIALGSELWASRRREAVLEQFLEEKGFISRAKIEAFTPSEKDQAVLDAERQDFIRRIYGALTKVA